MGERIEAELVASVREIRVSEGDVVRAGEAVVILEAMKLEIPVVAGTSGTVAKVDVAPGDEVQEGDLLAVIA
ncbi:biotin/lipoyl-binding carrier protein [Peterkaempfera bronchialis]|uniref:Biotin/lipoyl-binding carrier protein n=1 Tax=Peterkaempfera bronchialis TaxID=2126346 RepID=A0A345T070_9ACTN|nr:biotin/lipoyl-binding carrier protein [Peterkaempfera bronchialis]AXI79375.1 biotin/lipoyl-binding carrier protein [Peterkaempfera bronchialis]